MDRGNSSRSQSSKSSGASNKSGGSSQPRGGNRGGSGSSGYSEKSGEKIVRQICKDMAKNCTDSYPEQQFLAEHFYDKFMDGSYG